MTEIEKLKTLTASLEMYNRTLSEMQGCSSSVESIDQVKSEINSIISSIVSLSSNFLKDGKKENKFIEKAMTKNYYKTDNSFYDSISKRNLDLEPSDFVKGGNFIVTISSSENRINYSLSDAVTNAYYTTDGNRLCLGIDSFINDDVNIEKDIIYCYNNELPFTATITDTEKKFSMSFLNCKFSKVDVSFSMNPNENRHIMVEIDFQDILFK